MAHISSTGFSTILDGSEFRRSPPGMYQWARADLHPQWCRISAINGMKLVVTNRVMNHQNFQVPKMEVLNLIAGYFGGGHSLT